MKFVLCLDAGFVMPTGVAVRSLDRFLSSDDTVVVLHLGLSADHISDLKQCVRQARLEFIECSGMIRDSWVPPPHVSVAAFLRYLAPELLVDDSRCVYLDGDVIVRSDPRPLHDVDLCGNTLAAVRSRVTPFAASPGGIAAWFELGFPSTAPYFNSGVLAIDLDRWRRERVTDKLTGYLDSYGDRAHLADQEALNAAVVGTWLPVDRTWNYVTHVTESFLQQPELEPSEPSIVHFAGRSKPWIYGRLPIFAEEWFSIAESTPWSGFRAAPPPRQIGARATLQSAAAGVLRGVRKLAKEGNH